MKIVIAAVGRAKEPAFRTLLDNYYARISKWAVVEERELREAGSERLGSDLDALERVVGARAEIMALDVRGTTYDSVGFASLIGRLRDRSVVPMFVLGGSEGLGAPVLARAKVRLSLGAMTLPHKLARVVLAEQVYRAFTILAGEPYAREG
jgi:23S rRNA (pseudouridine1915-N3)-methyltransferase